jgi:hypothetical protein
MYRVFYAILFYFVDYGIPLSQIKIVLFILANRKCLIRRGAASTSYLFSPANEKLELFVVFLF